MTPTFVVCIPTELSSKVLEGQSKTLWWLFCHHLVKFDVCLKFRRFWPSSWYCQQPLFTCTVLSLFIQMLKDKRSSIEKKVFTTLNGKNRITHDNTGKQVLIQKLVQSSAILNEHNFFDYGMRSHLQTSEMIKGCTVLGCAHQKEQVSKHKHQPSLLPPIKLFHLLNPRQRHR